MKGPNIIILLLCTVSLFSQRGEKQHALQNMTPVATENRYAIVDGIMQKQNDSLNSLSDIAAFITATFQKDEDRARAIFYWTTRNISYSADLMFTYTSADNRSRQAKDAFENRVAVCIGYAVLFDSLCELSHLRSYVVEGSTRQSFLPSVIGHAWNAVMIDSAWRLVDPTWGSGYLQDKAFIRSPNDFYFLAAPEKLSATHLPIDPIWQMQARPINLYQFHAQLRSAVKTDWNYNDSINAFLSSGIIDRIKSTMRRLNAFGMNSEVTLNYFNYLKSKEAEYYTQRFNAALRNGNEAVSLYNDYVNFKNKQFTPARPDKQIAQMMRAMQAYINRADSMYNSTLNQIDDANFNDAIRSNSKQLSDLNGHVQTETKFVNKYLATPKNKRRDLFFTKIYTLYGTPGK